MPTYNPPIKDFMFLMYDLFKIDEMQDKIFADYSKDIVEPILVEAGKLASEVILPTNKAGDVEGCKLKSHQVITPQCFKDAFNNKPFRKLCVATFLVFNSFQTIAAFSFFIIVYHLFNGDAAAAGYWPTLHGCVGALVTTFVVIPIVTKMSEKMGKKNTFMISQGISVIGYILFWFLFIPGKPYMFLFALPFFSFGIGGLFTLMMSMTADVCDLDELTNGLPRKEGTFGAIYWWMVKFGSALAGLSSGLIMSAVDFTPDVASQPEGAITGLRFFYSVVPIMGTLIAMYVMRNYEITEERAVEIKGALEVRKNEIQ